MQVTRKIAEYVSKKGINLSALSRSSGVSYRALQASLKLTNRDRALRADELIKVCRALEIDPLGISVD